MEATNPVMTNDLSPAGDPLRPLGPEMISQMVKDSVERGQPNRELSTASRYLLLAATNICEEAFRNVSGFLDHFQSDEAEYWALDAKKAMDQTHRVLNVLAEIEGLDIP
ncbi:hypothetical protein CHR60_09820 [Faecalibacterium prausnitzii]|jgi:hypothetical protein|uniref:Uncharacterized protein n=1 Tax=Faecalibacterium prausnitzii TaxID=853 RepID=A0A2A7B6P2_9FIRM|nr:hypothetical protein [Faecalibacterium prausnitzii]PDX87001.1 hypothetical protein CHR60_09820 [Faecalibacterium prausnitzii]